MNKTPSNIFKHFEFIFSILSLLYLSQAIIPLFLTGGAYEGDGVNVTSLDLSVNAKIGVTFYVITLILLAMRWKKSLVAFSQNILLLLFLMVGCGNTNIDEHGHKDGAHGTKRNGPTRIL